MDFELTSLADLAAAGFDDIVDVRSPSEYALDHVPGAISLPAMSDAERAKVGTIYVREDRFRARRIGAAILARNTAAHLDGPLADKDGGWRPLVYCWRGGQRSNGVATILGQIGWRVSVLKGGYRSYRRLVVRALYDTPPPSPVVIVDGGTGTAKTRLLTHLAKAGAQVIDLEALAAHRGSLFGLVGEAQPSQKAFESNLAQVVAGLDPARPVFVEAESSKIGRLNLPKALWAAMLAAPSVVIEAPLAARAAHSVATYPDMLADPARLDAVLDKLTYYHGHKQVEAWKAMAGAGEHVALAQDLIARHYDPRYRQRPERQVAEWLALDDLSDDTLADAARHLVARWS